MHVLLLHSSSDLYGASKIFLQTVRVLQKQGHRCTVVLSSPGPLADKFQELGIPVHIFSLGIIRRKYFNLKGIVDRFNKWRKASAALSKIIKEEKIELIYSNTAAVLIGGYVARKHKIKHIWHIHEIISSPKPLHGFISWAMQNWCDKVIVVSKAVYDHWQKAGAKRVLLYNGIAPLEGEIKDLRASLSIPQNALVIGTAGRIHYWKGQGYFLDIAQELIKTRDDIYFIIAGDAFPGYEYLEAQIKERIQEAPLKGRVFFMGYCGEMKTFYNNIDLFVLPSQQPDPLPTVVLEAMGEGKIVVATEQGGALEMIKEGETGYFIPLQNASMAAQKINGYLHQANLTEMGKKGQERVANHFSEKAFEHQLLKIIGTVQ